MYPGLIQKVLSATRETKNIEFKREFDPTSRPAWCEVIKDIAAIANSGGGIIVFGLESDGSPSKENLDSLILYDPADVANKVTSFTGTTDLAVEVVGLEKGGSQLVAFLIGSSSFPLVFEKAGHYDPKNAKGDAAFAQGTIYFRHGAKSEPARGSDLRAIINRFLKDERKEWLSKVKKVTVAPAGSRLITVPTSAPNSLSKITRTYFTPSNDPSAMPILLTRDPAKASGEFTHEKISPELFDEINNIVDLNRLIAAGRDRFVLGQELYYRLYASRSLVAYSKDDYHRLLRYALVDGYAPGLFWANRLPPEVLGETLSELYLFPHNVHIHYLMRIAVLLGDEFCDWLFQQWKRKWKNSIQKPRFYSAFEQMSARSMASDPIVVASRFTSTWHKSFPEEKPIKLSELAADKAIATRLLNDTCAKLGNGKNLSSYRSLARNLDYIAHGKELMERRESIIRSLKSAVGTKEISNIAPEADEPTE